MNPPPAPGISPAQMTVLRIVCAMAWSDGELSAEETELMLDRFVDLFTTNDEQRQSLREELQGYMTQNLPLAELAPKLHDEEDRELALKLSYLVIQASRRSTTESAINTEEKAAYRRLIELLTLSDETVQKVEWAANQELQQHGNRLAAMTANLLSFLKR